MMMKHFIFAVLFFMVGVQNIQANEKSEIIAKQSKKTFTIALDSKGTPRNNGNAKTYPTIKDFREEGEYESFCYKGTYSETRKLLSSLVEAANGDGDSWAELVSISKPDNKGVIEVTAKITDESGEYEQSYSFVPCKK